MNAYSRDTSEHFNKFVNAKIRQRQRKEPGEAVAQILSGHDPNMAAMNGLCPICGERSSVMPQNTLCPRHLLDWKKSAYYRRFNAKVTF